MTSSQKLKKLRTMLAVLLGKCACGEDQDIQDMINIIDEPPTRANKTEWDETDIEYRLSGLLFRLIKERKPNWKHPDLQQWSKHVDSMLRIDKRDPKRIYMVIHWCQQDTFWQSNILSTEKLRRQFDRLDDIMSKDTVFMSKRNLMHRQEQVKKGPTMRELLKEQHG